ncbi:MAG: glycosyltransferase [Bacteroidetes bacterium]|nr:glycosyltransferase [Bacteroidota bacterium]
MRILYYFEDSVESTFGLLDIEILLPYFDKVVVFPNHNGHLNEYPAECEIANDYLEWNRFHPFQIILSHLGDVLEALFSVRKEAGLSITKWKKYLQKITSNIFRANEIVRYTASKKYAFENISAYAFWFYDSFFLANLKKQFPTITAVNRAHGGDIYEGQSTLAKFVLLRKMELKYLDRVVTVAKDGATYLQNRYPEFAHKISYNYLGILGGDTINPFPQQGFTIVTCSHVRDVKRVDKIAEVILNLDFPVTWYHIGNENKSEIVNDISVERYWNVRDRLFSKSNLKFIPKGNCSREEIFQFYETVPVNLFLSLSFTEGLPISMVEAISFGIPILATDVGGCREIVNEETGVLVEVDMENEEIIKSIEHFRDSKWNKPEIRKGIKQFWAENFDAEKNYKNMVKIIQGNG